MSSVMQKLKKEPALLIAVFVIILGLACAAYSAVLRVRAEIGRASCRERV